MTMEQTTAGGISTPADRDLTMRADGRRETLHVGVDGYRLGPAADAELRSALAAAPPSATSRQRG